MILTWQIEKLAHHTDYKGNVKTSNRKVI